MDILKQYEQQNPDASSQPPKRQPSQGSQGDGPIIRFVMRISGGMITNVRQVNSILIVVAVVIIGIAFIIFPKGSGNIPANLKVYKSNLPQGTLPQRGGNYPTLIPK